MFWLKQLWVQRTLQARPSHWTTVLVSLHSVFGELGLCSRHIKLPLKGCRPWTIFSVLLLLLQQSDGKVKWSSVLLLLISCWHFSCFTKLSVSWLNSKQFSHVYRLDFSCQFERRGSHTIMPSTWDSLLKMNNISRGGEQFKKSTLCKVKPCFGLSKSCLFF